MAPSEIEKMPYWEYELFRDKANEVIEEENKQQEEGNKSNNKYTRDMDRYMHNMPSYSKLSGDLSSGRMPSLPGMPSLPSFSGL